MKNLFVAFALLFSFSANAATFCHVETGKCLDPQANATEGQYRARYSAQSATGWSVALVPDGTQHGATATPAGGGSYDIENPAPVAMQSFPLPLRPVAFIQLVQTAGGMSDSQLVACYEDPNFKAMWIKFNAADTLDRDDPRVQAGLTGLDQAGYIPNHKAAVLAAWPK